MKVSSKVSNFMNNVLANVGLLLVLLATVVPFFMADIPWAQASYPYVFVAGALVCLISRTFMPYRGKNLRLRRWFRIQFWASCFFCMGAFFLFYPGGELRDWLAFTLAGAVLQALASIMIPIQIRKEGL